MLELFYFPECPYCQIVLRKISELQIQNEVKLLHLYEDSKALARLTTDTGRKTVPCLYIDNKPMFESADISNYLQQRFAKA